MSILTVREVARNTPAKITTGDPTLDGLLGGGIHPGVITELVGQSASGKTQLALQLSLCVQLPIDKGGLSGSACYLTTSGALQTSRLVEITQTNSSMTPTLCELDNIHTRPSSSTPELKHTLSQGIPKLIRVLADKPAAKPLRLLILDSIGTLFRSDTKTSYKTLSDRSREIVETASILHHLASFYHLAIIVINEVTGAFIPDVAMESSSDQLLYSQQARWFSRDDSLAEETSQEAALGLAWANQVGIRIMMSRTGRRRHIEHSSASVAKRRHLDEGARQYESQPVGNPLEEPTLIRRLSIIFSSFSPPGSIDFIITRAGIVCLKEIPK